MWVPVAVRRVANCYTPFTLLYFKLAEKQLNGQEQKQQSCENRYCVLRERKDVGKRCLVIIHTNLWYKNDTSIYNSLTVA